MKPSALLAFAIIFLDSSFAVGQSDPLEAEWKLAYTHDHKNTYPGCEGSRMIVKPGGRVVFELAGKVINRGEVACAGVGDLRRIDLHLADDTVLRGMYELKNNELIICFAEAGKDRPTAITPKGSQWAETWKRVKP